MKDLISFINEQNNMNESSFKEEVKYTKSDWEKWKKNRPDEIYVGNNSDEPELELVYVPNNVKRTLDHIATYNLKKQILFCDDISLFGHETK